MTTASKLGRAAAIAMLALSAALLPGAAATASPVPPTGNRLVNPSFETGTLSGWTRTTGGAGLSNGSLPGNIAAHDGIWEFANGGDTTVLSQTITDIAGTTYTFGVWEMDIIGGDTLSLIFDGNTILSTGALTDQTGTWTYYSAQVTGTGSDTVAFSTAVPIGVMLVDDTNFTAVATPEPASLAILATGLLATLTLRRRRT